MLQRAAGGAAAGAAAVAADGSAQRDGQPQHVAALVVEEAQRPAADARLREEQLGQRLVPRVARAEEEH